MQLIDEAGRLGQLSDSINANGSIVPSPQKVEAVKNALNQFVFVNGAFLNASVDVLAQQQQQQQLLNTTTTPTTTVHSSTTTPIYEQENLNALTDNWAINIGVVVGVGLVIALFLAAFRRIMLRKVLHSRFMRRVRARVSVPDVLRLHSSATMTGSTTLAEQLMTNPRGIGALIQRTLPMQSLPVLSKKHMMNVRMQSAESQWTLTDRRPDRDQDLNAYELDADQDPTLPSTSTRSSTNRERDKYGTSGDRETIEMSYLRPPKRPPRRHRQKQNYNNSSTLERETSAGSTTTSTFPNNNRLQNGVLPQSEGAKIFGGHQQNFVENSEKFEKIHRSRRKTAKIINMKHRQQSSAVIVVSDDNNHITEVHL